ncbi:MAG TPA: carbohydrate binding domain-containing protein [Actinospica sp.]|jgi:hypothetical protein|nr:carbohydrate binding domain-containing protein [Actinospica sp.]
MTPSRTPRALRTLLARLLATALAAAALTVGAATSAHASSADSTTFANWTQSFANSADVTFTADTTTHQGGSQSLKIVNASPKAANVYAQFFQNVAITPGTTYHLSAWVKASGVASTGAVTIAMDPAWTVRENFPSGTYDWTQYTWDYTVPTSQTSFAFRILTQDVGTTWIDDVSMVADGTTANLLQNASFETSTAPATTLGVSNTALVFTPGNVSIGLTSSASSVDWAVSDRDGQQIDSGTAPITSGAGTISLPDLAEGYYGLTLSSGGTARDTSFAVIPDAGGEQPLRSHPFGQDSHISMTTAAQMGAAVGPLGVGNVRFDVSWSSVELTAGVYTFDPTIDAQVAALHALGVRPLIILAYSNPLYDGGKTPSTPTGIAAFAAYAGAVAAHYGADSDYEVYNEYNGPFNNGACGQTAACYYQLLKPTADAIHAAAPGAWVVGPALAEVDMTFLTQLFDLGALNVLDVVSIHSYDWPNAPEGESEVQARQVRQLMDSYKPGVPLWWTEYGWTTATGDNTEAQQADYITRGFVLMNAAGVDKTFVYDMISQPDPTNALYNYGIMRDTQSGITALAPKPAYDEYAILNHEVMGSTFHATEQVATGVYDEVYTDAAGNQTRVLWATTPSTVTVTSTGDLTLTDTGGHSTTAGGTGHPLQLGLSGSPVYLKGAVSSIVATTTPTYSLTVPSSSAWNTPVPVGVSLSAAATADVTATDQAGVSVTIPAGSTSGTITTPAFPTAGPQTEVATLSSGGRTVALLQQPITIVESPVIGLAPDTAYQDGAATTTAAVRVQNNATAPVTISSVDWTVGQQSGTVSQSTNVAGSATSDIPLPVSSTEPLWSPLNVSVTAHVAGAADRVLQDRTAFAPAYPTGTRNVPSADLTTAGTFVPLNGGTLSGAADLSGTMWVSADPDTVTVHARILDQTQTDAPSAATIYTGDSIQFAFSPGLPGSSTSRSEFGAGLISSGPVVYGFATPSGPITDADATITRNDSGGETDYDITMPWSDTGVSPSNGPFSFSFLVNDNDGSGRKGYIEWGSGIGASKNTAEFLPIQPAAAPPDASLTALAVNGTAVAGFAPDTTGYTVDSLAGAPLPVVTATAHDKGATVTIAQATAVPGDAHVTVTSGDQTQTYAIHFNRVVGDYAQVSSTAVSGCDADQNDAVVTVQAKNIGAYATDIRLETPYGQQKFSAVAPGATVSHEFAASGQSIVAGDAWVDAYVGYAPGRAASYTRVPISYAAVDCSQAQ